MSEELSPTKEQIAFKLVHCGLTEEEYKFATDPNLLSLIMGDLEKTLKHDKPVKASVFATGVSSFLHDPLNLYQHGPSGVGKT